jgi:hypothetical protein
MGLFDQSQGLMGLGQQSPQGFKLQNPAFREPYPRNSMGMPQGEQYPQESWEVPSPFMNQFEYGVPPDSNPIGNSTLGQQPEGYNQFGNFMGQQPQNMLQ